MADDSVAAKNEIVEEMESETSSEVSINKGTRYYWRHKDEISQKRLQKKLEDPEYRKRYEEKQRKKEEKEKKKIEIEKRRELRKKLAEQVRSKKT
jgi:Tfp pilus assembly pilus retraction ATPase PilT